MEKYSVIGNMTADPILRNVNKNNPDGTATTIAVCNIRLAVRQSIGGNTVFRNVTLWRGLAETVAQYCRKGSKLFVEGELRFDNNGQLYVQASGMEMLSAGVHTEANDAPASAEPDVDDIL